MGGPLRRRVELSASGLACPPSHSQRRPEAEQAAPPRWEVELAEPPLLPSLFAASLRVERGPLGSASSRVWDAAFSRFRPIALQVGRIGRVHGLPLLSQEERKLLPASVGELWSDSTNSIPIHGPCPCGPSPSLVLELLGFLVHNISLRASLWRR